HRAAELTGAVDDMRARSLQELRGVDLAPEETIDLDRDRRTTAERAGSRIAAGDVMHRGMTDAPRGHLHDLPAADLHDLIVARGHTRDYRGNAKSLFHGVEQSLGIGSRAAEDGSPLTPVENPQNSRRRDAFI